MQTFMNSMKRLKFPPKHVPGNLILAKTNSEELKDIVKTRLITLEQTKINESNNSNNSVSKTSCSTTI